jgi:outer membrane lipoprotein SlyB
MEKTIALLSCLSAGLLLQADTLYLRDGRVLDGTFLSGTSREVRFLVRDANSQRTNASQRFPVTSVDRIAFGATTAAGYGSGSYRSSTSGTSTRARNAAGARYTVPSGTIVTVRTIDKISSDKSDIGQTFQATLEDPIIVNGRTLAPKGADVTLRVANVDESSGITGTEDIALELAEIKMNGRSYPVNSTDAQVSSKNRSSESIKVIGGTAVLGAIIGAIAGGGKGAAIGAATGAGAGAAIQAIRGQKVEIEPESILQFSLAEPVYID